MNWLDLVFIGIIAVSVVISLVRGFVREVISIVVWAAAFWISIRFAPVLSTYLEGWVDSPTIRLVAAFAGLFVVTLILGAIINYLAGQLVGRTGLTGTDRMLGVVFGGLRGGIIVGLLVLMAGLTSIPQETWWRQSRLAGWFTPWVCSVGVADWLDGLELYRPVVLEEGGQNGTPAPRYWQDFCTGVRASR